MKTSTLSQTPPEAVPIDKLLQEQRAFFYSGQTLPLSFRKKQLVQLKKALQENEAAIYEALKKDFQKSPFETFVTEIAVLVSEIDFVLKHIDDWAAPKRVASSLLNFPSSDYVYPQPFGVCLIIGAWNYPLHLTIAPAIPAIAAGNCVVLKPSELSPHTSALIKQLTDRYFDPRFMATVEGGVEVSQKLLEQAWDKIFFTGSTRVGKIVMEAAAKHLTPVVLELGGKSPAVIDASANIETAAKRIIWGKMVNAGQTCVAPDFVLVHEEVKELFLHHAVKYIKEFYGEEPELSPDFPRIVNSRHFERLSKLLERTKGRVVHGGQLDATQLYIAPTIVDGVGWDDSLMEEELFGPILPVLTFTDIYEVMHRLQRMPHPLSMYIFTNDKKTEQLLIERVPFGGGCVNDVVVHLANHHLPFGGIGPSGMGNYHGKYGFDAFTHYKGIVKHATWLDVPLRYAPYEGKLNMVKKLVKWIL